MALPQQCRSVPALVALACRSVFQKVISERAQDAQGFQDVKNLIVECLGAEVCFLCCEKFVDTDDLPVAPDCGHAVHFRCFMAMLCNPGKHEAYQGKCRVCRCSFVWFPSVARFLCRSVAEALERACEGGGLSEELVEMSSYAFQKGLNVSLAEVCQEMELALPDCPGRDWSRSQIS
mmetsp:Transcript_113728/g.261109  ORF Transcript_113728/g.261109 Transcript_113728/m.261109 type:complete len:177 (+) Transcript_113728:286-816(+)